jgi:hypothetical protein
MHFKIFESMFTPSKENINVLIIPRLQQTAIMQK